MAHIQVDKKLLDKLKKLEKKKLRDASSRWDKTRKAFEAEDTSLDLKPHKGQPGIFKIKLKGKHDGYRVYLFKAENGTYHAFDILDHDSLDKK